MKPLILPRMGLILILCILSAGCTGQPVKDPGVPVIDTELAVSGTYESEGVPIHKVSSG
jgi:hypothetical protein